VLDCSIRFPRPPRLAALVGAAVLSMAGLGCGSGGGATPGTGGSGNGGSGAGGMAGQAGAAGGSGGTTAGSGGAAGAAAGRGGAGTAGAGTGGTNAAGTGGRGGTTGAAGTGGSAVGTLPPPQPVVKMMAPGWNLGNSFDASPNETSFGNPTPNQTLINAVHAAGFNTLRIPVTWTSHIGAAPAYTINAAWMTKVTQTAQWGIDAGMYVFVNTHHESDGNGTTNNPEWVTFPQPPATSVATEVTAVWTQIANAFKSFNDHLMLECFNEPNEGASGGSQTQQAQTDLNLYLEACVNAIRGTGGANATRLIMIQPVGASPDMGGIQSMMNASIINDPNLLVSIHTYYPTNFGLSTTQYAWGSSDDYTSMQHSIDQNLRVWMPTQPILIGEWGSQGAQPMASRVAHALAYSQDVTTAGMVPIWWDNGGSGSGSYSLFNRTSGAQTQAAIISAIMTGVKNGQASPNNWATLANP